MMQASETPYLSDAVRDKLHKVHHDARMFDIYEEYLASWHEYSGLMISSMTACRWGDST